MEPKLQAGAEPGNSWLLGKIHTNMKSSANSAYTSRAVKQLMGNSCFQAGDEELQTANIECPVFLMIMAVTEAFLAYAEQEKQSEDDIAGQADERNNCLSNQGASEPCENETGQQLWDSIAAAKEEASRKRHSMLPNSSQLPQSFTHRPFTLKYRPGWADAQAQQMRDRLQPHLQNAQVWSGPFRQIPCICPEKTFDQFIWRPLILG